MTEWRRWGLGLGLLGLALWCGCWAIFRQPPLVGVIIWDQETRAFQENLQGILEGLREQGCEDGLNLRLRVVDAKGDRGRVAAAAEDLENQGARLLITLGTIPTLVALEVTQTSDLPVVYSMVGAPAASGLGWPAGQGAVRFTGASTEVPLEEQLRFFQRALPRLQRLGLLFCTVTPVAEATGAAAEQSARKMGLVVVKATVTDDRPHLLEKALSDLCGARPDAVFLPQDPVLTLPRNLEVICRHATAAGVPLMASMEAAVPRGALLAYHADAAEVGRQAGRQAALIFLGAPPRAVPPEGPRVKRLTLNVQQAQLLQIPLSRHLLSRAHELY